MPAKGRGTGASDYVRSPIGFFVLSLLIVESFVLATYWQTNSSDPLRPWLFSVGLMMFLFVFCVFAMFLWVKPHVLMFDANAYLRQSGKKAYGTKSSPRDAEDIEAQSATEVPK